MARAANEHFTPIAEKIGRTGKAVLRTKTGRAVGASALGGAAVGWALPLVSALAGAALAGGATLIWRAVRERN